jgi:hypothetical protein
MKDMERRKFEDSFQEAFKDAEANPSEIVWANIELELEKTEGGKMKRRLMFFKTLAAASVIFAVMIGGVGYYFLKDSAHNGTLADQAKPVSENDQNGVENSKNNEQSTAANSDEKDSIPLANKQSTKDNDGGSQNSLNDKVENEQKSDREKSNTTSQQYAGVDKKSHPSDGVKQSNGPSAPDRDDAIQNKIASATPGKTLPKNHHDTEVSGVRGENDQEQNNQLNANGILNDDDKKTLNEKAGHPPLLANKATKGRSLPSFFKLQDPTLKIENSQPDPGAVLLAKLAAEEQLYAQNDKAEKKNDSEKLWTSLGFAAGGFNALSPSVSSNNTLVRANLNNAAVKQSKASGVAYSVGFSVGTKIAKRWIVQGGFNYMTQSSDYTANSVIVDNNFQSPQAESLNAYKSDVQLAAADVSNQKVAPTVPYTVNNNVQFVSLPVQAGYMFINKRFGLQLNAGVSTDFFLQNTITPEAGGLSKTTQGRGADSPYRSLNFSGLMGTEFSYKLGSRYRVALNPGLRYPFNSVYKTDTGVNSMPLTFDVGLRFRYIFH